MIKRYFITLIIASFALLSAKSFSYSYIDSLPYGTAKDYYIWRYISQKSTTKKEAEKAVRELSHINPLLKKAYRKKTGKRLYSHRKNIHKQLSKSQKEALKNKKLITIRTINSPNPINSWKRLSPKMQIFVFNYAGKRGRKKLDHTPTIQEWQRLSLQYGINGVVHYILKEKLPKFSKALSYPPGNKTKLSYNYLMKLGFKYLLKNNKNLAERYFYIANLKAYKREMRDRALFWAWKANNNRKYLNRLIKSYDINIYTLGARDAMKIPYNLGVTPKLPNAKIKHFNIYSPVAWTYLKRKIFSKRSNLNTLAEKFKAKEAIGYYTYIKSKASKDTIQYFPMPYRDFMKKLPVKRQAILYAIARQESRFIPPSISSSFALGMMQIMPFLVEHLSKQMHEKIDYDDMFNPYTSLRYANEHLNYLTKWLHHPLFVAYAYNAGIGYTRRLIKRYDMFRRVKGYEPWLSLERVSNMQANDYGKKVLANYVIYMNKLGYKITLTELLSVTNIPKLTDEFRKKSTTRL